VPVLMGDVGDDAPIPHPDQRSHPSPAAPEQRVRHEPRQGALQQRPRLGGTSVRSAASGPFGLQELLDISSSVVEALRSARTRKHQGT